MNEPKIISDKVWREFENWYHSKWISGCPKQSEVELFLQWNRDRVYSLFGLQDRKEIE